MRIMNKDVIALKETIITLVDERDKLYVIPLLDDLEMPYTNIHLTMDIKQGTMKGCKIPSIGENERGSYK